MTEKVASFDDDPEIRHSMRVLQQQRTTRMMLVILGIIVGLGALFGAVYLAYGDEPDAAKPAPVAPAAPR
jgi:hypothetical protein